MRYITVSDIYRVVPGGELRMLIESNTGAAIQMLPHYAGRTLGYSVIRVVAIWQLSSANIHFTLDPLQEVYFTTSTDERIRSDYRLT